MDDDDLAYFRSEIPSAMAGALKKLCHLVEQQQAGKRVDLKELQQCLFEGHRVLNYYNFYNEPAYEGCKIHE